MRLAQHEQYRSHGDRPRDLSASGYAVSTEHIVRRVFVAALVVAIVSSSRAPARADDDETTIDVHLAGGFARLGEDGTDETTTVPAGGLLGRLTYGLSDRLALDAELSFAQTGAARFDDVTVNVAGGTPMTGALERSTRTGRAMLGASLRLGVRVIPVLEADVGVQARWRGAATFAPLGAVPDGYGEDLSMDLVVGGRVGLDYRFNEHWIAGVRAGGVHAVTLGAPSFDAGELSMSLTYAWYRRWWWWE